MGKSEVADWLCKRRNVTGLAAAEPGGTRAVQAVCRCGERKHTQMQADAVTSDVLDRVQIFPLPSPPARFLPQSSSSFSSAWHSPPRWISSPLLHLSRFISLLLFSCFLSGCSSGQINAAHTARRRTATEDSVAGGVRI